MDSPFGNIYVAILGQIQARVPAITHIDQELGQLKNVRPPVSWPCVLVDFEDFRFENLGEHVQLASGIVVLRLGFAPYSNSTQATPGAYTEKALWYYGLEWALHKALQGWAPAGGTGSLCRTATTTQKRTDNYRVRELRYSLSFEDYSTKRIITYVPASVVVS